MRIWDLPPSVFCREHLLGEHSELHALWQILVEDQKAYNQHPETCRWRGKRRALFERHRKLVEEMKRRGYDHDSPLNPEEATGSNEQTEFVNLPEKQEQILKRKDCSCFESNDTTND